MKKTIDREKRIEMVKAMNLIALYMNDENDVDCWLTSGVADGDTDFEWYTDDESFADLLDTFVWVMRRGGRKGHIFCDGVLSGYYNT